MAGARPATHEDDLSRDLSRLTASLEAEMAMVQRPAPVVVPLVKDQPLSISAPPGAVLTVGFAICVGAVWMTKALSY